MRFKWFLSLLILPALFGVFRIYKATERAIWHEKGFSLEKIICDDAHRSRGNFVLSPEVVACLRQPFFYLARGKQCYAFESSDGQYVLKFFQQQHFRAKNTHDTQEVAYKKQRLQNLIQSCRLAAGLPEETGVFYVYMGEASMEGSGLSLPQLTLLDMRGQLFTVPLEKTQFVLQYKVEPLKQTLIRLMHDHKEAEAKKRIEQIFTLLVTCRKKGIEDRDEALIRNNNIGFVENRAVYIDTGQFAKVDTPMTKADFDQEIKRLRPLEKWLEEHYPVLAEHFHNQCCQQY